MKLRWTTSAWVVGQTGAVLTNGGVARASRTWPKPTPQLCCHWSTSSIVCWASSRNSTTYLLKVVNGVWIMALSVFVSKDWNARFRETCWKMHLGSSNKGGSGRVKNLLVISARWLLLRGNCALLLRGCVSWLPIRIFMKHQFFWPHRWPWGNIEGTSDFCGANEVRGGKRWWALKVWTLFDVLLRWYRSYIGAVSQVKTFAHERHECCVSPYVFLKRIHWHPLEIWRFDVIYNDIHTWGMSHLDVCRVSKSTCISIYCKSNIFYLNLFLLSTSISPSLYQYLYLYLSAVCSGKPIGSPGLAKKHLYLSLFLYIYI